MAHDGLWMMTKWNTSTAKKTGLGYGKLLHGEAVAIGMHMAADMSCRMGWIDQQLVDRTVELMVKARLPVELPKDGNMDMEKFLNVSLFHAGGGGLAWRGVVIFSMSSLLDHLPCALERTELCLYQSDFRPIALFYVARCTSTLACSGKFQSPRMAISLILQSFGGGEGGIT